jgi:hypothetical protein
MVCIFVYSRKNLFESRSLYLLGLMLFPGSVSFYR